MTYSPWMSHVVAQWPHAYRVPRLDRMILALAHALLCRSHGWLPMGGLVFIVFTLRHRPIRIGHFILERLGSDQCRMRLDELAYRVE